MANVAETANEEELNPLTGNDGNQTQVTAKDNRSEGNMVKINLENPRDPPQPSSQQQMAAQQQQQSVAPGAATKQNKDWAAELGMAWNKGYNWFPLGVFAWIGGWLLIATCIGDMISLSTDFIEFWFYVYLIIGALLILVIDCPTNLSAKAGFITKFQLIIFDWIKLFR